MRLDESDLPEYIWDWKGKQDEREWWDFTIPPEDDLIVPPIEDYVVSLNGLGYHFKEIPGWGAFRSPEWGQKKILLASGRTELGPHFLVPSNTLFTPPAHAYPSNTIRYRAFLHELSHSTSHASRLNRLPMNSAANTAEYAREECVADLSGALLYVNLGGDPAHLVPSWACYVHTWDKVAPVDREEVNRLARNSARLMLGEAFGFD